MPPRKLDKVLVSCPQCGHKQPEPRAAFSSVCKGCGQYFRVQEVLHPARKTPAQAPKLKRITCFSCGVELEVALNAQSTICKKCSSYIDLHDHQISKAISRNFKTKGALVVQPKGYVFNTDAMVGEAVIKGRFFGKLNAERSLTIYSSAQIKGSFTTGHLIIPAENHFQWKERISVGSAEIAGELAASLRAKGAIILKSTARLFGDLEAESLVVEDGAILVGTMKIGAKAPGK